MISKYSIAVLPFTDSSQGKDQQFLSDGMTMGIIHSLSRYNDLHVTSRYSSSRFSTNESDIPEIRKKLNVAWLLDGNIQMRDDTVSVTVQLIRTRDSSLAGSFTEKSEFGDIPHLQEQIAATVAAQIITDLDPGLSERTTGPVRSEALEEYLKGQYLLNQLDSIHWKVMMGHFKKSLELDPDFSRSMVAMCHSYTWLSSIGVIDPDKARSEIDELIKQLFLKDHQISDVYQLQAEKCFWIEWKPLKALENINTALELNQSNSSALVMKGLVLASLGEIDEALDALFRAERLDPYGENVSYCIGLVYRYTGDYNKAYKYIHASLDISPNWLAPYFTMMEILCIQNRFSEAEAFIENSKPVPGFTDMIPVFNALVKAYNGKIDEATLLIRNVADSSGQESAIAPLYYNFGMICLQLNLIDDALQWISKGIRFRSTPFLFIQIDSTWDRIKNDPRFAELSARIGFPSPSGTPSGKLKYGKSRLDNQLLKSLQHQLNHALNEQKTYLDPTLSLSDLAEMCDVTVNQLSQYLNGHLGKTFYDYLNRFRLDHFLELAGSQEMEKLSILGLAYESGFNSKTTFNTFFKKELKVTPRAYLKQLGQSHSEK